MNTVCYQMSGDKMAEDGAGRDQDSSWDGDGGHADAHIDKA
jgi:hypothetical protein